ncbi:hypothetical protein QSV08_02630 [Maribacter sp. BPC-D8]|uniref:leucine-rich repeat domain-containing protein n=1 Tax=Maribacter sp. BPC-D8 TaxID=3053613 RepID=UPI002B461EE7|nr:hypothetical protein [Maribacter sp. BPC-D8]WRI30139.1 hypothetical protein QSV08_02630 [Maribacter sp. BPC-D8]
MKKIFLILLLISHQFCAGCISDNEKEFLQDLITENSKLAKLGWSFDNDYKQWKGLVIEDCKITTLDLSNFNLSSLPNSIIYLSNLETLKLSGLKIHEMMSRNLFGLKKLKKLHLKEVYLKKVIHLFGRLENLKELKIIKSYINSSEIPIEFLALKELESIDFSENNFKKIPSKILELKKLKYISFKDNKYLEGDISLFNSLTQLEYLDFSNTAITGTYTPLSVNLKYLNLSNPGWSLNVDISNINKLEVLKLEKCKLKALTGIEKQEQLTSLNIKDNYFSGLNVSNFIRLDSINISKNELVNLPLFPKKTIAYLNFSSNPVFEFTEQDFKVLSKVKSLDLSNMILSNLPITIKNLKKCEVLNLSNNKLEVLPKEINNLQSLKKLNLSKNELHNLAINGLVNLTSLDLRENNLSEFNLKLKHLKKLNLLDNSFTKIPDIIYSYEDLECFMINDFTLKQVPEKVLSFKKMKEFYVPFEGYHDDVLCKLKARGVIVNNYNLVCNN